jgi:hypothetical protein
MRQACSPKVHETMTKLQQNFPFHIRLGASLVTVTGLHHSKRYYTTDGYGLVPQRVTPIEAQEPGPAYAQVSVTSPKAWKRQGCFRREPLTVDERNRRAERARSWLRKTLDGGLMPAAEVIRLAHKAGLNEWALRRAKKRLGVRAVKVGGRRQGWGAKWFWRAAKSVG